MSDLADRMRAAANTLEEANQRYSLTAESEWRPCQLRREARHVEDEDQEAAELQAMTEEMARILSAGLGSCHHTWEDQTPEWQTMLRKQAHNLIQSGWRKIEPE